MREAYRLHQHELREAISKAVLPIDLHIVFSIRRGTPSFIAVENDIKDHIRKLISLYDV